MATINAVEFTGPGTYEIRKGHITSPDVDFEVRVGDHGTLHIAPEGDNFGIVNQTVTHFGTVTGGVFNTGIMNAGSGMRVGGMQITANQDMHINGVRYRPYTIRTGRLAGIRVYAPEDYELAEAGSGGQPAGEPAPRRPKTSTRDYAVIPNMRIDSIEASTSARVVVADSDVVASSLSIDASSAAYVEVRACVIDRLSVDASSAAVVDIANVRCNNADLDCSSAAKIQGPMAEFGLTADASSAGSITASAARNASVNRETSDVAKIAITRY